MVIERLVEVFSHEKLYRSGHRLVEERAKTTFMAWKMGKEGGCLYTQDLPPILLIDGQGILDAVHRLERHPGDVIGQGIGMDGAMLESFWTLCQKDAGIVVIAPNDEVTAIILFEGEHSCHGRHLVDIKLASFGALLRADCLKATACLVDLSSLRIHEREDSLHVRLDPGALTGSQDIRSIAAG